jgi:hypothetical protein
MVLTDRRAPAQVDIASVQRSARSDHDGSGESVAMRRHYLNACDCLGDSSPCRGTFGLMRSVEISADFSL